MSGKVILFFLPILTEHLTIGELRNPPIVTFGQHEIDPLTDSVLKIFENACMVMH